MSDSPKKTLSQNSSHLHLRSASHSSQEDQKKDIIVSIILTESTTSLLKLDLPHLEDTNTTSSVSTVCAIKAEKNIEKTSCHQQRCCKGKKQHSNFWFSGSNNEDQKKTDCEKVSSEVAYFSANTDMEDSSTSLLQVADDAVKSEAEPAGVTAGERSSSFDQKLKPTMVYIRPLYTVRSVAHQNHIKSQANDIYISIVNSKTSTASASGWVNVCRICHGGKSSGELCAPCRCRGSIAMAHLQCLERWLKESANSHCELCQHHYRIVREPKYGVVHSVFVFLRHPGEHLWELLYDICGFAIYTPAAMVSTYMLMLLCESAAKYTLQHEKSISAHIMAITAVFGLAAVDFTYSAWLMTNLQKHILAWRSWYRNNCELRLILSENKQPMNGSASSINQQD